MGSPHFGLVIAYLFTLSEFILWKLFCFWKPYNTLEPSSSLCAESEQGIFDQVLHGSLDFEADPWPSISDSAKDLVKRMLVRDPKKRLTAYEVLCEFSFFSYLSFLNVESPGKSILRICIHSAFKQYPREEYIFSNHGSLDLLIWRSLVLATFIFL